LSAAHYAYDVVWSEEERNFIARVKEFPSLEARADSRGGALRALKSVVYAVAKELVDSGAESPEAPPPDTE
jgi:predicted RNase H-like HicB family nuclease